MKVGNKKSIFKKWWFWLLAVIIVIGATGSGGADDKASSEESTSTGAIVENTDSNKDKPEKKEPVKEVKKAIKSGTYKVGTDLEAGEYLFIAKGMGYIECTSDSTGALERIVFNDNVQGHSYLTVNDGEYLKINGGELYKIADAPSVVPANGLYKDGMYKVGQDIPAGEYKVVLKSPIMGYYEVSSNSRHDLYSIITNENVQGDTYLTIQDGQYLKLNGVEIQK